MTKRTFTITDQTIAILYAGAIQMIPSDHAAYGELRHILETDPDGPSDEDIDALINPAKLVTLLTFGSIKINDNDIVIWNGKTVPDYLAHRILADWKAGHDLKAMFNFAEKCMANTNPEIVADLFRWLEKANMPICSDGDFLAFRRVREDWKDPHSGTVLYTPGEYTEIDPKRCTFDRNQDCGPGLHFANREYSFSGNRLLLVKIDPRWVTSIPRTDSKKGRCHKMFVVRQITTEERDIDFAREGVVDVVMGYDGKVIKSNYAEQGDPEDDTLALPAPAPALVASQPLTETPFVGHAAYSVSKASETGGDPTIVKAKPIPKAAPKPDTSAIPKSFTHKGATYTAKQIEKGVKEQGQRGFAVATGIPRTTLQGWIKLLNPGT